MGLCILGAVGNLRAVPLFFFFGGAVVMRFSSSSSSSFAECMIVHGVIVEIS